jgi:hypothetical protein
MIMKLVRKLNFQILLICLGLTIFNPNLIYANKLKKIANKNFQNFTSPAIINIKKINNFPIKIVLEWRNTNNLLNLHLKRLNNNEELDIINKHNLLRFSNDTIVDNYSQMMMIENLTSGNFILYAEKFESFDDIQESKPIVKISYGENNEFDVICPIKKIGKLYWEKFIIWEIGLFTFNDDNFKFEKLNSFTNKKRE